MTSDAWKDREKAAEDRYFQEQEQQALERLKSKRVLKSPVTGEPMETITVFGVNVDRCKSSGGIWLDHGELEKLIQHSTTSSPNSQSDLFTKAFTELFKKV